MNLITPIKDPEELVRTYLRVKVPKYADALMTYLNGVAHTDVDVLADTVDVSPVGDVALLEEGGNPYASGVILRYEVGVEKHRYNKRWIKTKPVEIIFEERELI